MGKPLLRLSDNTYGQIVGEASLANIPFAMPYYNLVLHNQRKRVRYPETLDLPDIETAQRVARRVASIFMEVVPYWSELPPDQQSRYVVEVMDEAGRLVLTVPFKEAEEGMADQSEPKPD